MRSGAGRMRACRVAGGWAGAGITALVLVFSATASSWASGPLDGILACRRIADSSSRLACFDRESAALRNPAAAAVPASSEPGAKSSHEAVARNPAGSMAPTPAPTFSAQQTFGLPPMKILEQEEAAQRLPPQLDYIIAHIQAVSLAADGRDIFTLDNHEVWAQLVPDGELYARPGDTVKISRAMLGSYWLALKSRRGGCKVTRLQ